MKDINKKRLWALGLIEAEGYIGFNVNSGKGTDKEKWLFTIKVAMHRRNSRAVYRLKEIYGVGKIHVDKFGMCVYKITDSNILRNVIVPILDENPPRGVKYHEYIIFKKGLDVMKDDTLTRPEKLSKMRVLKEESHKIIEISPIVCDAPETKKAEEVIDSLSVDHLKRIYPSSWIAAFIEGDGSFQINDRLQTVFEIGQMNDKMVIYALHKIFNLPSKIKIREDGYTTISTKFPRVLEEIMELLKGEMLGMKSFEYEIWCKAYRTKDETKKLRAKKLLEKLRKAELEEEESVVQKEIDLLSE